MWTVILLLSASQLTTESLSPLEAIEMALKIGGAVALWCLALRIRFVAAIFWKIYFMLDVVVLTSCFVFIKSDMPQTINPVALWLFLIIVLVPYYSGLFTYAFRSHSIWIHKHRPNHGLESTGAPPAAETPETHP